MGVSMRAVVQRVTGSRVIVDQEIVGKIDQGLVVLLGVNQEDTVADAQYLADKIAHLRIFEDENEKMNLSVQDIGGAILSISQFTLCGDCRTGRRPSFTEAARPEQAKQLYDQFNQFLADCGVKVATGQFQAHMLVGLENDGPVTMLLDSKRLF